LTYLSIRTRETPELVEYPDSGQYAAIAAKPDGTRRHLIRRDENRLDYWLGTACQGLGRLS
jgi:uncharacterized cupin superfamily protein